ncbi:MAG: glycosyltransferase [Patescibacteria group bacterium]
MNQDLLVDIIIPLYNEETNLAHSVKTIVDYLKVSAFPYQYTITLANNASTDSSWKVCQDLVQTFSHVKALDVGAKGKGLAIRTAWSQSSANILAFMDVDLSSDLGAFRRLVDGVIISKNDLVIGCRLGKDSQIISNKILRKIASRFYNFVVRLFLRSPFPDHQCGFKAMDKKAFDRLAPHLSENGFFFDTELIASAVQAGLKIQSIDIVWHDSPHSKVSLFSDSLKMFLDVIRLRKRLNATQHI